MTTKGVSKRDLMAVLVVHQAELMQAKLKIHVLVITTALAYVFAAFITLTLL